MIFGAHMHILSMNKMKILDMLIDWSYSPPLLANYVQIIEFGMVMIIF